MFRGEIFLVQFDIFYVFENLSNLRLPLRSFVYCVVFVFWPIMKEISDQTIRNSLYSKGGSVSNDELLFDYRISKVQKTTRSIQEVRKIGL